MNSRTDPTVDRTSDHARRVANRRLGLSLAVFAVALFLLTMYLRS